MKTFHDLPEELKELCRLRCAEKGHHPTDEEIEKARDDFQYFFWNDTPEGYSAWFKLLVSLDVEDFYKQARDLNFIVNTTIKNNDEVIFRIAPTISYRSAPRGVSFCSAGKEIRVGNFNS